MESTQLLDEKQSVSVGRTAITLHQLILAMFVIMVAGAFAVRLATFERFLPYMDYTDETWYYGFAQEYRGEGDFYEVMQDHTAPPLQAFVSGQILNIVDSVSPWPLPSVHIYWLRAWAVVMGTITTAVIVWGAWQLGGPLAGGLAGFIWAFHPQIVNINSLAVSDPYMYMFVALTLAFAIRAWQQESPVWLGWTLLTGVAAIYSKYWNAAAVVPFVLTALYLTWKSPRRMVPWLAGYTVFAAISAFYLLSIVDPLTNAAGVREVDTFRTEGLGNAFDLSRISRNLRFALYPIAQPLFYGGLALGAVAYVYNRRHKLKTPSGLLVGMLFLFCLLTLMNASTFTVARLEVGKLRHVLPVAIGTMLIWGLALSQVQQALAHLSRHWGAWARRISLVLVPFIVLAAHVPTFAAQNTALALNYQKMHIAEVVWNYTDASLPQEGLVWLENGSQSASVLERLWNRPWGGYDGDRPFEWWNEPPAQIAQQTPDELHERNITHLIFTDDDLREDLDVPGMDMLLEQMLLVKTIPAPDVFSWHGTGLENVTEAYIYRVQQPQHTSDVTFGEQIELLGYDMPQETVQAGEAFDMRFFWQANETPASNYNLFAHLTPADSADIIAQLDGTPALPTRPTVSWDDPSEVLISDTVSISVPEDVPAGDYVLRIGLYDFVSGQRLATGNGQDHLTLPVQVR